MMKHKEQKIKCIIIMASLLLHCILFAFLLIPQSDYHPFVITTSNEIPASVLNTVDTTDSHIAEQTPDDTLQNKPEPATQEWAAIKARASQFGAPVEFIDYEDIADPNQQSSSDSQEAETAEHQENNELSEPEHESESEPNNAEAMPLPDTPFDSNLSKKSVFLQQELQENNHPTPITPIKKKSKKIKGLGLKDITQCYLQNEKNEGAYGIEMMGDPNKRPTQEQLKYEQFFSKLAWHFQNAQRIRPLKAALPARPMTVVYFTLNKKGIMSNLQILESCGSKEVDAYIISIFEYASLSFPPLPSFIKDDPLPIRFGIRFPEKSY